MRRLEDHSPHGNGSHILCADGHAKHFTLVYYPDWNTRYNPSYCWDKTSQQWWNYNSNPNNGTLPKLTIAVTP